MQIFKLTSQNSVTASDVLTSRHPAVQSYYYYYYYVNKEWTQLACITPVTVGQSQNTSDTRSILSMGHGAGRAVVEVSEKSVLILNGNSSETSQHIKMEALPSFETSVTTNPATRRHIPKQLHHQFLLHFYEKLKRRFSTTRKYSVLHWQVPSSNDGRTIITRYFKSTHTHTTRAHTHTTHTRSHTTHTYTQTTHTYTHTHTHTQKPHPHTHTTHIPHTHTHTHHTPHTHTPHTLTHHTDTTPHTPHTLTLTHTTTTHSHTHHTHPTHSHIHTTHTLTHTHSHTTHPHTHTRGSLY